MNWLTKAKRAWLFSCGSLNRNEKRFPERRIVPAREVEWRDFESAACPYSPAGAPATGQF